MAEEKRKKPRGPKRTGWLKDPCKARQGETIGGGHWVFRRGDGTGRIRPANWPFEHPTREQAEAEASKLAAAFPGETFIVVSEVSQHAAMADADPAEFDASHRAVAAE